MPVSNQYKDPFIASLVEFVAADDFQKLFETFFLEHSLHFSLDSDEHKLEYHEIYRKFREMFESKLEIFCNQQKLNTPQFMSKCKAAAADDPKVQHYIDVLLASVEYETFYKIMKVMRPVAERKKTQLSLRADEKTATQAIKGQGAKDSSVAAKSATPPLEVKPEVKPSTSMLKASKKGDDDDDDDDAKSSKAGAK